MNKLAIQTETFFQTKIYKKVYFCCENEHANMSVNDDSSAFAANLKQTLKELQVFAHRTPGDS